MSDEFFNFDLDHLTPYPEGPGSPTQRYIPDEMSFGAVGQRASHVYQLGPSQNSSSQGLPNSAAGNVHDSVTAFVSQPDLVLPSFRVSPPSFASPFFAKQQINESIAHVSTPFSTPSQSPAPPERPKPTLGSAVQWRKAVKDIAEASASQWQVKTAQSLEKHLKALENRLLGMFEARVAATMENYLRQATTELQGKLESLEQRLQERQTILGCKTDEVEARLDERYNRHNIIIKEFQDMIAVDP